MRRIGEHRCFDAASPGSGYKSQLQGVKPRYRVKSSPGSDMRVRILYSNIPCLHANLDELAEAGSDYDVLLCAESKISDRCHLSELSIHGFGCPQQRLRYSTPGTQGMAICVGE